MIKPPNARIDTVEIDEAVVRGWATWLSGGRFQSRHHSRRSGLRQTVCLAGFELDLIILDAFNGEYIPEHLMTVEFLQEMRALLSDNGVLVANTFASQLYHYESATYAAVFGQFLCASTGNRVILVPQAKLPAEQRDVLDAQVLRTRAAALQDGLKPYGVPITRYARTS